MASLRDLVRTILPLARPVGTTPLDPARGEREVTWVRVLKARVPAFEALESGDLAIIPGPALAVVAPSLAQTDDLAAALARARSRPSSSSTVTAARRIEAPDRLLERRADRPARRQDESDRPRAERDRLPRQSPRGARPAGGRPRGPAGTAGTAGPGSRRAGRGDRRVPRASRGDRGPAQGDPIAVHAPGELEGAGVAVSRYLSSPQRRGAPRHPDPRADEPGAGGRLVLLGDDPPNELERIAADRIAALLALELARDAAVRQARGAGAVTRCRPRAAVGRGPRPPGRRRPPRRHRRAGDPGGAAASRLAASSCAARYQREPGAPLVAAAPSDDPEGLAVAARIAAFLGRLVAVSRPFAEPGARPAAEASARATLEAAEVLDEPPAVARASPSGLPAPWQRSQPARWAAPGQGSWPMLWAGRLSRRSDCGRSRRSSRRVRSEKRRPGWGSTETRSRTGCSGWRRWAAGPVDPDLRFSLALATRIVRRAASQVELPLLALRPDAVVAAPRAQTDSQEFLGANAMRPKFYFMS